MKNRIIKWMAYIQMLFAMIALICGFAVITSTNSDWLLNLFIYVITILITALIMYFVIKINREKDQRSVGIFISYTEGDENSVELLKEKITQGQVIMGERDIRPGDDVEKEAKRYISKCAYCFVLIGNYISPQQKYEIKEMLRQNKKIIPIRISHQVKVPSNLRLKKSILLDNYINS